MTELLVLGDSHTPIFNHPAFKACLPAYAFKVVTVVGATASGLENPNTRTQAYPIFQQALGESMATTVIVLLGEVDTGFVIWYRANKYQESVPAMLDRAIGSYGKFLLELAVRCKVVCISAPLPTIRDGNDWGEVANARREVTATQLERTLLTLDFNRQMHAFCSQHGMCYIGLDEACLADDGLVKASLLNKNPNDHHYDSDTYAACLIERLTAVL